MTAEQFEALDAWIYATAQQMISHIRLGQSNATEIKRINDARREERKRCRDRARELLVDG